MGRWGPRWHKNISSNMCSIFSFSQIFVIFVIAHWSSELWSQCDRLTLVNIERRSSWRKDNVCFWSQSVKLHSPPKDWWTINSSERERERWLETTWKWREVFLTTRVVAEMKDLWNQLANCKFESKIFLPGIYYFARDHFHCIARSRRRAAIRGRMEHTCWSLGIISPIFDNWIFDHLIWYLIWAHMLKLIRYLIKNEIFGYKSAISDRFLPSMPSVARS